MRRKFAFRRRVVPLSIPIGTSQRRLSQGWGRPNAIHCSFDGLSSADVSPLSIVLPDKSVWIQRKIPVCPIVRLRIHPGRSALGPRELSVNRQGGFPVSLHPRLVPAPASTCNRGVGSPHLRFGVRAAGVKGTRTLTVFSWRLTIRPQRMRTDVDSVERPFWRSTLCPRIPPERC